MPDVFSLVLAGGASSRMGADKALLSYGKGPQVRRVAGMLERLCPPVSVSVRRDQLTQPAFAGLRLLPDREEGVGPLEGLLCAFREASHCAWLVVAVDMPYLSEATLEHLLESRDPSAFATAYRNPETDRPEPVCAIYEPRILPVLQAAKAKKRYSLMLLRDVPIRLVEPVRAGELRNINDPDELRQAGGELPPASSPPVP
jgi:molybdopterin-guanine dinucleotide biosynthesis protein A